MATIKIFHLTYTSVGRLPFFTDVAAYRQAVRRLAGLRHTIALFSIVFEHLHQVTLTDGTSATKVSMATKRTLEPIVAAPFDETNVRAVADRDYVENLFRYHLKQPAKHNVPGPPALWEGSCFLDLIGARWVRGLTLHIERIMPGFDKLVAYRHVGLSACEIQPATADQILRAGSNRLASAATSALAAPPSLDGNTSPEVEARCVVAKLGRWAGFHDSEIAAAVRVKHQRSVRRLRKHAIEQEALDAVRMRIALEDAVGKQADRTSFGAAGDGSLVRVSGQSGPRADRSRGRGGPDGSESGSVEAARTKNSGEADQFRFGAAGDGSLVRVSGQSGPRADRGPNAARRAVEARCGGPNAARRAVEARCGGPNAARRAVEARCGGPVSVRRGRRRYSTALMRSSASSTRSRSLNALMRM
jgi:hypothetical protein